MTNDGSHEVSAGEDELRRLNRTLRAHTHSAQALLRAEDESSYLAEVCRIIIEDCGHAMVWIGNVEQDEAKTVRPIAYAGFEDGYLETLRITWADTERGLGPTGTAIRTGKPSVCRDMLTDPQFAPWKDEALQRGYASSLALPLLDHGRAFGVLALYAREPDPFTEDEVALLTALASDLAYGITTLRLRAAHAQAEAALRQSEERFAKAFRSSPAALSITRLADGRFVDVNDSYVDLFGYTRDELIGHTALELGLYPDPVERDALVRQLNERGTIRNYELVSRAKSGALRTVLLAAESIDVGGVAHSLTTLVDVTKRKRAEAERERLLEAESVARREAERQSDLRLRFLGMITHELRTPLTSIKGFATTLLADDVVWDEATQRDFLQTINLEADKLNDLIGQLLDFSRIEAGSLRVDPSPHSLAAILEAVRQSLDALAAAHTLQVTIRPDLPQVQADIVRVGQVLINLVGNAAKYSPSGTTITIMAVLDGRCVQVSVSDEGPGIAPEDRQTVFEAFRRGSSNLTRRTKGAGLGLAICKGIVEAHGGRIWVEAREGQGLGQGLGGLESTRGPGTTISFTLPIAC